MGLRVYNTLTGGKEDFIPSEPGLVKIYVCGVTPYNHPHIGNARPFVTWDVFRRYLEFSGYNVLHVQNFTDIDDKIIKKADEDGISWEQLSEKYIADYFAVMDKLKVRRAHIYPLVSRHMAQILDMISKLIDKGHAYAAEGSVYYRVSSFAGYGKLSDRSIDDMRAGARVDVDETKEHPMDFALWKAAKPGEPAWESPWGHGRPGWHIECSAMSICYLGTGFDFHGGGSDLMFPHHENEIAQSEAFSCAQPFVRYWLHNGFITLNTEKMSKSTGNFFLVKDILAEYKPEILRFFILSTHYRSPLDFSDSLMDDASRALDRLHTAKTNLYELSLLPGHGPSPAGEELQKQAGHWREAFIAAMDDDFNTALAISNIFSLSREINIYAQKIANGEEAPDGKAIQTVQGVFSMMTKIIGLFESEENKTDSQTAAVVDILINMRQTARNGKDYKTADQIRQALGEAGIVLEDTPQGVKWHIK